MDPYPRDRPVERDILAWSAGLVKPPWPQGDTEPIELGAAPEFDAREAPDASDESPVFLDPSGRRRRAIRSIAILAGCAGFAAVALLCAALLGAPITPSALFTGHQVTGDTAQLDSPSPPPTVASNGAGALRGRSTADTTTTSDAPAPAVPPVPAATSTPSAPRTTTPTVQPNPAAPTKTTHVPPGKPTELPTPPGHTR